MKRSNKKLVSIALAALIVLALPMGVFAADETLELPTEEPMQEPV